MRITLVGDVMLGRLVNEFLKERPAVYPWGDTLPVLKNSTDLRFCNLECVISDKGKPWSATPKEFHFRSDAKNIQVLLAGGIDVISVANNHSLDYGYEAAVDMLKIFDGASIKHSGLGKSLDEAERLVKLNTPETRVGFVAFTDNEPEWEATKDRFGVLFVPTELGTNRSDNFLDLIRRYRSSVDYLIVSAHWGSNWGYEPPPEHILFAHALVEAGADTVFGHSPHVFRGIEIYRNRPIFYSAGNFIDDYAIDPVERNDESSLFVLEVKDSAVREIEIYPAKIKDFQVNLARGPELQLIGNKMQRLCRKFGTKMSFKKSKDCYVVAINNQ